MLEIYSQIVGLLATMPIVFGSKMVKATVDFKIKLCCYRWERDFTGFPYLRVIDKASVISCDKGKNRQLIMILVLWTLLGSS